MIRYLKKGATEEQVAEVDRKVRQTVEKIIDDVGHRGDARGPGHELILSAAASSRT